MIRILHLLKSQLGFSFSGSAHNTHEEIHQREGTTRHTASGATVVVAPTMAKVQVRGQEGEKVEHGKKVYYKTPAMDRKKKGTIVGGSHEEGYVIQPVRQGYTLRPPQVAAQRDHIWTEDEHQAEKARSGARETTSRGGSTISIAESNRRAEAGQQRAQLDEGKVLTSPLFVGKMKGTLAHLASTNGFNPQYRVIGGALYNDDQDANELYSEYVAAAMNSYRTETSKAPEADLEELRTAIANGEGESRILTSMLRAGKTAAIRHIVALTRHNQEHDSYDGAMEDDQESGMREIAGQAHHTPEHESDGARRAQLMQGIVDQLDALDDPIAASIVKMKFGLAQFDHGYKEQDIAAALNRANMPAPDGDRWDADQVKERMASALANLGRTRGVQELRGLVKSLQELQDLRKAMAEYEEEPLIKSHIKQYMKQDGTVVTEHDDRRIRKHSDVVAHENAHGDKVHPGSKLQHGEDLMKRLREKGWKEKETHPVKKDSSLQAKGKEDLPEPSEVKGANKENPALVSAQRIITKMHEAAKSADDPVAALTAIHTSRANPYLKAVDDEREKLLAHFGHKVDRDATASKFEKDGHTIVMDKDRVHFAGADPDKAKGQVTSIAGRRQVEETDTGKKDAKFIIGRENKAYTAQLDEVKSNYALVEAHQLTTSHTIQGHINRAYPQEIQPRERERLSSQMQMANIMNDIKPELFGHSATAADGAPIVGKDGAVESGNGRTIALTEAYKRGLADKYKEWLKKEAEHFGLKPEDVDGMEQPMLVRVRAEDDANTDRAEFARKANQSSNLGSSPAEQAWSDSERIDDALLKKFTVDEDGEIYNEDNMDFINGFLAKLGRNEAASLRDADGDPNRKAIERIQNAVFTKVYGSSVLTELQSESAKPRIRNILRALNACVGDFAQVKGHDDLDVVPDMMEAIEYTLAHQGQSRDELEHTLRNAGSLNFTGDTPTFKTDYSVEMILAIADRTGSRNRLQNVFKGISHAIKTEVHERENPEVDMFSGPTAPKSKEKVVKQALEKVNGTELQKAQSFYPRGLGLMLLKNHGGNHGRERALPTQKQAAEERPAARRQAGRGGQAEAQKEAAGGDRGKRGAGREGQGGWRPGGAWLLKSVMPSRHICTHNKCPECGSEHTCKCLCCFPRIETAETCYECRQKTEPLAKARVRSYFRVTQHGALSEVMEHEDRRVRRYGQHIASTQDSADLHRLRRERFAHLPHWGDLDEKTRLKVLDAEEIAAGQHTRREARKQAAEAPMAEHLPGDQSGLLQMRMFKSIRIAPAWMLRKSQLDLFGGGAHHIEYTRRNQSGTISRIAARGARPVPAPAPALKQAELDFTVAAKRTRKPRAEKPTPPSAPRADWTDMLATGEEIFDIIRTDAIEHTHGRERVEAVRRGGRIPDDAYRLIYSAIMENFSEGRDSAKAKEKALKISNGKLNNLQVSALQTFFALAGTEAADTFNYVKIEPAGTRAHATKWLGAINVTEDTPGSTIMHEAAHHIEFSHPSILVAAEKFRDAKAKSSNSTVPKKLKEIVPRSNYKDDEIALQDRFVNPYVGKVYPPATTATEVVSMGMQHFIDRSSLQKLAEADPTHLNFMLGLFQHLKDREDHEMKYPHAPEYKEKRARERRHRKLELGRVG